MESSRLEALVEESVRISKQNAAEIKKIRKELFWMSIFRIVVWLILAGVPIFLYLHFVKPPIEGLFGNYESVFERN